MRQCADSVQFDRKVLSIARNIRPPSSLYKPQDGGSKFVRKAGTSLSVCVRLWHLCLVEERDVGKILCFRRKKTFSAFGA
jgi:hypothetical protein